MKTLADLSQGRLITAAEAAALCGFSLAHFRRLYRARKVPSPIQINGRKMGWRACDLDEWLKAASSNAAPAQTGIVFGTIAEGLTEALAIAKGEEPAARIWIDGHAYVSEARIAAALSAVGLMIVGVSAENDND